MLPPALPASRSAGAITATCSNTAPRVAASARAKPSGGWSITLIAYTPPGRSTRSTCSTNSLVARCQGTASPPNASPMARSNGVVGRLPDAEPGVADPDLQVGRGLQAELVPGDLHQRRIEFEHQAGGARGSPTAGSAAW